MVIMTHVIIPTESAKETGKRYIGMPPLPDYLNLKGPYIYVVEKCKNIVLDSLSS